MISLKYEMSGDYPTDLDGRSGGDAYPTRWFSTCYINSFLADGQPACEPTTPRAVPARS
jgi:hypothetical protein